MSFLRIVSLHAATDFLDINKDRFTAGDKSIALIRCGKTALRNGHHARWPAASSIARFGMGRRKSGNPEK